MADQIVLFSRLLRIFKFNNKSAYIIELESSNKKTLYISYFNENECSRNFESYEKTKLKEEFKNLSAHCLMSQCKDATSMFAHSPLTHFEANCSSLVNGVSMFSFSSLKSIKTEFPLLKNGSWMFCETKIKEIKNNFPKLKYGVCMFTDSPLEKITAQFLSLENGQWMFGRTPLKKVDCQFPNMQYKEGMFSNTPDELKENYPHYFI